MTELLVSDITRMGRGFCVIGIERIPAGYRSVRPIPVDTNRWSAFPHRRADRLAFDAIPTPHGKPHVEDQRGANHRKIGSITEEELVQCLKKAEVARSLRDLFGCRLHLSPRGGGATYVNPEEAQRSICGCTFKSIRFSFDFYPPTVRVALGLDSGETLASLPLVDHDWHEFIAHFAQRTKSGRNARDLLGDYFENSVEHSLLSSQDKFVRIGLTRPFKGPYCWLMLDSLFPLPHLNWR